MQKARSPYRYPSQVPAGDIRLLLLHPDQSLHTASGQQMLHLTLHVVRLERVIRDLPRQNLNSPAVLYTAFSYVWGPEEPKHTIAIDFASFEVRENLFAAICHLIGRFPPPYWIDAICIDQNNQSEKSHQLRQMGDVYRKAGRVIVWLGPGDAKYGKAMAQIDRAGANAQKGGIDALTPDLLKQWPDFGTNERLNNLKADLEAVMKASFEEIGFPVNAFLDLMDNSWFERAWTMQELAVANHFSAIFVCGLDQISYEHLAPGYKLFLLWYAGHLRGVVNSWPGKVYQTWKFYQRMGHMFPRAPNSRAGMTLGFRKKYWEGSGEHIAWKHLLTSSYAVDSAKSLQCRDPQDRIYALRGLTKDAAFLDDEPLYSRPYQELYIDVARYLIAEGHLDILSLCRSSRQNATESSVRDPSLPSWVPDWSKPILQPWGLYKEDNLFKASLDASVTVPEIFSGRTTLVVRGWWVDTIQELGEPWQASLESFDWTGAKAMLDRVEEFVSKSTLYSAQQRDEAVWRIPIANKEHNHLMQIVLATEASYKAFLEMKKELNRWLPGSRLYSAALTSYMNMMWSMYDSRPFISAKGYVGMCPATARAGDNIYCLAGSHVPYVLRESTLGRHKLVGEVYVEGVMHGDFVTVAGTGTLLEIE